MNKSGYLPSLQVRSLLFFFLWKPVSHPEKSEKRVGEQTQGSGKASQTYIFFLFSARYHLFLKVLYFLFSLLGHMVQTRIRWFLSAPGQIIELCHV